LPFISVPNECSVADSDGPFLDFSVFAIYVIEMKLTSRCRSPPPPRLPLLHKTTPSP
jgi:hypothetical protein